MSCRVGMTTDIDSRKRYWEGQHSGLYGWEILGTYNTKTEAQNAENNFASSCGCVSHPGGDGNEDDTWHVYKFSY